MRNAMTSAWEQFEELIKAQMRKIYSETVIDHAMNPRNLGDMEDADGFARVTGPCGDTMEIWLRAKNGNLIDVTFLTDGCGTSLASGSMVTEMSKGKDITDALKINQQDVLRALGGLPEESQHCALLAADTLKEAIRNYRAMTKETWKKAYRKH
jgi:nitrogen fixation protein NifU and related proteins